MDRAEAAGLGVATAGHLALLAALSLGLAATRIPPPRQDPIEVSFVDDAAPVSTAPDPSPTPPAPPLAQMPGPPQPPAPVPVPTSPVPAPPQRVPAASTPVPAPAAHRPAPVKPAPAPPGPRPSAPVAKPSAARPTGRLSGLLSGVSDSPSSSRSTPAAVAGPAVKSSLIAEMKRQLRPRWQQVVPSGADMESLRTDLALTLGRDGTVTHVEVVGTRGVTPSNKPQVPLHQERAKKAVMLASPFHLPPEHYDAWRQVTVTLDLRLSQ